MTQPESNVRVRRMQKLLREAVRSQRLAQQGFVLVAGPILGTILVVTVVKSLGVSQGMILMLVFAAGQGIPLLVVALPVDRTRPFLRRLHRSTTILSYIGSAILIFVGTSLSCSDYLALPDNHALATMTRTKSNGCLNSSRSPLQAPS